MFKETEAQENPADWDRCLVGGFLPDRVGRVDTCIFDVHSSKCTKSTDQTKEWLDFLETSPP
jgi:hypothetical protein